MTSKVIRVSEPQPESARLDSWKEIAGYLRRGARTVQRWEREAGLPVHRLQHDKLGSVYAYKAELDAWFERTGGESGPMESVPAADTAPSLAVLPFTDMSPEQDLSYFCDGLAEEIVSALSGVPNLRTASRTSSFRFRDPGADVREIGRQIGVKALLEGSVRKAADRLRISVQLIDTESGFQLWGHRYDRVSSDTLSIQEKVAESVVRAVEATLSRKKAARESPPVAGTDACECYYRGRKYYEEFSPQGMEFAIEMFVRAIGLDPHSAQSYAGLADCWSYSYLYAGQSQALLEQSDWASLKAQEIDPHSAQAHASRALWLSLSGRTDEADSTFETAARLDPDLFEAHYYRARHLFSLGRFDDAVEACRNAMRVRPEDYQTPLLLAQIEGRLGRGENAALLRKQGVALAERLLEWNPGDARALYLAAKGLAALGEHKRSRRLAERALAIRPDDPMLLYGVACAFSLLGLTEMALDCLEKAAQKGFADKGWIEHDSDLDALRPLPRLENLLTGIE